MSVEIIAHIRLIRSDTGIPNGVMAKRMVPASHRHGVGITITSSDILMVGSLRGGLISRLGCLGTFPA